MTPRRAPGRALVAVIALPLIGLSVAAASFDAAAAASDRRRAVELIVHGTNRVADPRVTPRVAGERLRRGPLVRDPAAYANGKRNAEGGGVAGSEPSAQSSSITGGWPGVFTNERYRPDTSGAVGLTRYLEVVQDVYGIYDRQGTLLETGRLSVLAGLPAGAPNSNSLASPQAIWDADTERFYVLMLDVMSNTFVYAFSTTSSPSGADDFCSYALDFGYGDYRPDSPRLGTTDDFLVIGVNVFDETGLVFEGSDILWLGKPPAGNVCPAPDTITGGGVIEIRDPDGSGRSFSPVPAVQIDPDEKGWVLALPAGLPSDKERLTIFEVTTLANGAAAIPVVGSAIEVAPYNVLPSDARQPSANRLETLDGRLTGATMAVDPERGATAVWTQHTVKAGAGSGVRWYELNPSARAVLQTGTVSDPSLWVFNGAISPDRRVNGESTAFGSSMALIFNTSSETQRPRIAAVTKAPVGPTSAWLPIRDSNASYAQGCIHGGNFSTCLWGETAAATPDPAADPSRAYGAVWFSNQYVSHPAGESWNTWNGSIDIDQSFGYLRIVTSPAVRSQISVDGQIMDSWGLNWVKVLPGPHTVSFSDVEGYATPEDIAVVVAENATTTATGVFVPQGSLRVLTSPPSPGTITIDGIPRNDWGVWSWFPSGAHTVCFGAVADSGTPACQPVVLTQGSQTDVTGTYVPAPGAAAPTGHGYLRVTTSPPVPSQIRIDGVGADTWGLTWLKLQPGSRTISFTDVEGYTTPADAQVTISPNDTTTATGVFTPRGLLRVVTEPAIDATVYVDGVARNDWGLWTWFPTGRHAVCFDNVPGLRAPPCTIIELEAGGQVVVTGTYTANAARAGRG